jgi:streptomycin 6-kinase
LLRHWSEETRAREARWTDVGLVREGLRTFDDLLGSAREEFVLATDLHAGNVLRAERETWLAIDPKPFVGEAAYDATQHLFNCRERLLREPVETIRRFAELLEVDEERVRQWTFARAAAEPREDWGEGRLTEIAKRLRQ